MALHLVQLTGPDGQDIEINPVEVVSLREPRGTEASHFHNKVKCLIFTTDGKFVGVQQDCERVRELLLREVD
jgi:hypothetical protein